MSDFQAGARGGDAELKPEMQLGRIQTRAESHNFSYKYPLNCLRDSKNIPIYFFTPPNSDNFPELLNFGDLSVSNSFLLFCSSAVTVGCLALNGGVVIVVSKLQK